MLRLTLVALVALTGCTTTKYVIRDRQLAAEPGKTGPLAELERRHAATAGTERSGFKLLEVNEEALHWRLALIDSAQHSLDVMTFLWWGDEVGDLVLKRVIDAADRGVKVRLIVDDMTTIDDGKELRLRDVSNAAIDAHPNIELRIFNPWSNREAVGRAVEFVGDFTRLNQRMHNKALIADNRAAIMGGRNLGNEYMGLSPTFNFRDVDVLSVGPATRQVSGVFDRYWNSEWVVPLKNIEGSGTLETLAAEKKALADKLALSGPRSRSSAAPSSAASSGHSMIIPISVLCAQLRGSRFIEPMSTFRRSTTITLACSPTKPDFTGGVSATSARSFASCFSS